MRLKYKFRRAEPEDFEFYKNLHHEVLKDYVTPIWGWDAVLQDQMVKDEFDFENTQIIQVNNQDVGVVIVKNRENEFFISQLWILPAYQRKKIGTRIVKNVTETAQKHRLPVRLHVLKTNPARSLYERLGFIEDGEDEGGFFMRKDP